MKEKTTLKKIVKWCDSEIEEYQRVKKIALKKLERIRQQDAF